MNGAGTSAALQLRARELAQGRFAATAAETDRSEQYPWANVELLRDAGFMGMTLPTRVGGQGPELPIHGSSGYGRDHPLERHVRDARMFTIAGGTTQILRTQLASTLRG